MEKSLSQELAEIDRDLSKLLKEPEMYRVAKLLNQKISLEAERCLRDLSATVSSGDREMLTSIAVELAQLERMHKELLKAPLEIKIRYKGKIDG